MSSTPIRAPEQPFDRLPPQNVELEMCVIGSVLLDSDAYLEIADVLSPEDFYRDSHQIIWGAIVAMFDSGSAVDGRLLAEELARRGELSRVGGDAAIHAIIDATPHAANARYYAQIVHEKATARALLESAKDTLREIYSNNLSADDLLESAERRTLAIGGRGGRLEPVKIDLAAMKVHEEFLALADGRRLPGLPTGLIDLDAKLGGLQGSQLAVLAARPAMGKTSLALNIAEFVAKMNSQVLFVSLEMTTKPKSAGNQEFSRRRPN